MSNICDKCGGRGVVYVDASENTKEVKPKPITLYTIGMELENDLTEARSRFARVITKVFGIIRK